VAIAKQVRKPVNTWKTMENGEKALFLGKLAVMLCSFGFIFGGVLVEGKVYETLPDAGR
jgi:hypothetical protein